MGKRRKKGDSRNIIIGVLSLVVILLTFLLFSSNPQFLSKFKSLQRERVSKSESRTEKTPSPKAPLKTKPTVERKEISRSEKTISTEKQVQTKTKPKPDYVVGKIAVVLDDWGYHLESCQALKDLPVPIAVAILPNLQFSKDIARCAYLNDHIVMLHLPLEPHKYMEQYPDNYYIKTWMDKKQIERMVNDNISSIPHILGVNNHTGSKATEDSRVMSVVLQKIKDKNLFFVDSLVTSQSVCGPIAKKFKVKFAKRDVFLDNENDRSYIENQFRELARLAETKGYAVGIGHDRPLTLKVLKEQVEKLEDEGFEFVGVDDLLK